MTKKVKKSPAKRNKNGKLNIPVLKKVIRKIKFDKNSGSSVINPKKIKSSVKTKNLTIKAVKAKALNNAEAEELIHNIKPIKQAKIKRLFFDIETSYNIVKAWRAGYKLNISPDDIIHERAVICVCWKWEGESKVHELHWNKGDDKQLLIDFVKVMNQADEILAHNGDRFDIKWLRTRCLYHKIRMQSKYNSIDTLKMVKKYFLLNSNKLDYVGQFTRVGKKMETGGLKLWDAIILDNDPKAMDKMIKYCKVDVIRLQQVFDQIVPYADPTSHAGVLRGGSRCSCAKCGSKHTIVNGNRISATGIKKKVLQCKDCGSYQLVPETVYNTITGNIHKTSKTA